MIFHVSKVNIMFFWNEKLRGIFLTWQLYRQSLNKTAYYCTLFGLNVYLILNLTRNQTVRRTVIFEKLVFSQKFGDYISLKTRIALTYFNNQLNAQILLFYNNMYVKLQSSTCFEH